MESMISLSPAMVMLSFGPAEPLEKDVLIEAKFAEARFGEPRQQQQHPGVLAFNGVNHVFRARILR